MATSWVRDRARVVEVDVSPAAYDWHIDGAVLWNIYTDLKDADYRTVGTAALERLVARSGISPDSTVVFYGYAPALGLWLMRLHGHPDVRILDCSRDTWQAGGHPWSTAARERPVSGYRLDGEDHGLRADRGAVQDAIGRPGTALVDVRSAAEYRGDCFWPSGAHVIVTARRADRLTELAHECQTRMETLAGDITDPAHRQRLADAARRHGRLDILVNNAGICDDGPLEQQSLADLRQVVNVNLVSVLDLCRLTAGLLRAAPAPRKWLPLPDASPRRPGQPGRSAQRLRPAQRLPS